MKIVVKRAWLSPDDDPQWYSPVESNVIVRTADGKRVPVDNYRPYQLRHVSVYNGRRYFDLYNGSGCGPTVGVLKFCWLLLRNKISWSHLTCTHRIE